MSRARTAGHRTRPPRFSNSLGRDIRDGLELTVTDRFYTYQNESSGDWLIDQGRLDPSSNRCSTVKATSSRFRPCIDSMSNATASNRPCSGKMTTTGARPSPHRLQTQAHLCLCLTQVIIDANLIYGVRKAKKPTRSTVSFWTPTGSARPSSRSFPVKRYTSSVLNVLVVGRSSARTPTHRFLRLVHQHGHGGPGVASHQKIGTKPCFVPSLLRERESI